MFWSDDLVTDGWKPFKCGWAIRTYNNNIRCLRTDGNRSSASEKLATIKRKLAENRLTTPLFDTKLFTKHIEAAYIGMYERYQAGLSPDHIVISN